MIDGRLLLSLLVLAFPLGVCLAALVAMGCGPVRGGYRPKAPKGPIVPPKGNAHSATPAPPQEIIVTIKK